LHGYSSFKLAYPSSFCGVFVFVFYFAMIASIGWREQIIVQARIHPQGREMIALDVPVAYVTFSFFCLADQMFCNLLVMYAR